MSTKHPALLIISGGSEVVSLALAEAAAGAGIGYVVFSLVPGSLLHAAPGCLGLIDLSPLLGDWDALRDCFLRELSVLGKRAGRRLAILPSEDGGLRLLNECVDDVLAFGEFSRARVLGMGGVDKAEVVLFAQAKGLSDGLAPSMVIEDPAGAVAAIDAFGLDAVFKPSLKPLDMDLTGMGGHGEKVVTRREAAEPVEAVIGRLRAAWRLSERWIAQPRLRAGPGLERSVCAVRGTQVRACQVVERAKYPQMGGTAYWVSIDASRDLVPSASVLLDALDFSGICELSYLPNADGKGELIELNPRPWLQVGLIGRAGFPIVEDAIQILGGLSPNPGLPELEPCDWLQLERLLLSLRAGECSVRRFLKMAAMGFGKTTVIGGYGTSFPGVRRKMAWRVLQKAFGRR